MVVNNLFEQLLGFVFARVAVSTLALEIVAGNTSQVMYDMVFCSNNVLSINAKDCFRSVPHFLLQRRLRTASLECKFLRIASFDKM